MSLKLLLSSDAKPEGLRVSFNPAADLISLSTLEGGTGASMPLRDLALMIWVVVATGRGVPADHPFCKFIEGLRGAEIVRESGSVQLKLPGPEAFGL